MVRTVRLAGTGTITAVATTVRRRRRVRVRTSGHGTRVLGEVRPRSRVAPFVDYLIPRCLGEASVRAMYVYALCLCEYLFCPHV